MNVGAWTLTAYHGVGAAALAREWLRWGVSEEEEKSPGLVRNAADGLLVAVADFAGIPIALLLASYTGVLLTGTSNPTWVKSTWLPALFSSSAMTSGSAAVRLALEGLSAAGIEVGIDAARRPLNMVHTAAHLAEVALLVGYLSSPAGQHVPKAWRALGAIAGSELLRRLPGEKSRFRPWFNMAAAAFDVVSAYHLRSALILAGHAAANDPRSRH